MRRATALVAALALALPAEDADDEAFDISEILIDRAMVGLQVAAVLGPREALGDSGRRDAGFARWPWADGEPGYALPADGFPGGQRLVWRLSAETGDLHDLKSVRERVELLVEGSWRYGVAVAADAIGDRRLWSADLLWRPAQGPLGVVRTGGGPRFLIDDDDHESGFGLVYDVELFPVQPVIIGLRGEFGWLDDDASVRLRAQAGISVWRIETYGGWDGLAIGEASASGPFAGMRLRW
jgi:hypothetical protein